MANSGARETSEQGVVATVFEGFIAALRDDKTISSSVIDRLHSALLENEERSVDALRKAIFPDESSL